MLIEQFRKSVLRRQAAKEITPLHPQGLSLSKDCCQRGAGSLSPAVLLLETKYVRLAIGSLEDSLISLV